MANWTIFERQSSFQGRVPERPFVRRPNPNSGQVFLSAACRDLLQVSKGQDYALVELGRSGNRLRVIKTSNPTGFRLSLKSSQFFTCKQFAGLLEPRKRYYCEPVDGGLEFDL